MSSVLPHSSVRGLMLWRSVLNETVGRLISRTSVKRTRLSLLFLVTRLRDRLCQIKKISLHKSKQTPKSNMRRLQQEAPNSPDFIVKIYEPNPKLEVLFTISEEEGAEMYLGNTPIEVDLSTAIYMLQKKDNMPEGMAWGNFFPA